VPLSLARCLPTLAHGYTYEGSKGEEKAGRCTAPTRSSNFKGRKAANVHEATRKREEGFVLKLGAAAVNICKGSGMCRGREARYILAAIGQMK
jgi:hypothetical protein